MVERRVYSKEILEAAKQIQVDHVKNSTFKTVYMKKKKEKEFNTELQEEFVVEKHIPVVHYVTLNPKINDFTCDCEHHAYLTAENFLEKGYCKHIIAVIMRAYPSSWMDKIRMLDPHQNRFLGLLDGSYRKDFDQIKISAGNTWLHEIVKSMLCKVLKDKGHKYVTEAYFSKGGRADILDIKNGWVFEVGVSEDLNSFLENKREKYPKCVEVAFIDANIYKNLTIEKLYQELSTLVENTRGELDKLFKL